MSNGLVNLHNPLPLSTHIPASISTDHGVTAVPKPEVYPGGLPLASYSVSYLETDLSSSSLFRHNRLARPLLQLTPLMTVIGSLPVFPDPV